MMSPRNAMPTWPPSTARTRSRRLWFAVGCGGMGSATGSTIRDYLAGRMSYSGNTGHASLSTDAFGMGTWLTPSQGKAWEEQQVRQRQAQVG